MRIAWLAVSVSLPPAVVEQDVQTALEISSRAYVLETGRIALSGPSRALLDDPQIRKAYLGV